MTATKEHEPAVQVSTHGCRVLCSCGWATHRNLEEAQSPKRDAMARWYDHYLYQRRLSA